VIDVGDSNQQYLPITHKRQGLVKRKRTIALFNLLIRALLLFLHSHRVGMRPIGSRSRGLDPIRLEPGLRLAGMPYSYLDS